MLPRRARSELLGSCPRMPRSKKHASVAVRLQEVVGCSAGDHGLAGSWAGVELEAAAVSTGSKWLGGIIDTYNVYFRCSSISMIAA